MNVPGEPCRHPGCLSHISHPCEVCGRIAGRTLTTDEVIVVAVLREISERGCSSEITACRSKGTYGELFQGIRRVVDRILQANVDRENSELRKALTQISCLGSDCSPEDSLGSFFQSQLLTAIQVATRALAGEKDA